MIATTPAAGTNLAVGVPGIIATALAILSDRQGFNRAHSKRALKLRIQPRKEHDDPSYIPSKNPSESLQADRKLIAELGHTTTIDTPVTPSDVVTA